MPTETAAPTEAVPTEAVPTEAEVASTTIGVGSGAGGVEVLSQITDGNPGSLGGTSAPK